MRADQKIYNPYREQANIIRDYTSKRQAAELADIDADVKAEKQSKDFESQKKQRKEELDRLRNPKKYEEMEQMKQEEEQQDNEVVDDEVVKEEMKEFEGQKIQGNLGSDFDVLTTGGARINGIVNGIFAREGYNWNVNANNELEILDLVRSLSTNQKIHIVQSILKTVMNDNDPNKKMVILNVCNKNNIDGILDEMRDMYHNNGMGMGMGMGLSLIHI